MKRYTLAAAAVLAVGLTCGSMTAFASTTVPKNEPVVIDCLNKPRVEPGSFVLACADGYAYLSKMSWTSWTPRLASATGTFIENDCLPTCVGGHFHSYPALVVLWGAASMHGKQRFTELTLIFTGQRPAVYSGPGKPAHPRTQTFDLWAAQAG
jgi:hypothetical protein